jgi:hypothetical protein
MAIDSILRLGLAIDAREAIKTIANLEKRGINLGMDKNLFKAFSKAEKKFSKAFSKDMAEAMKNGMDVKQMAKMEKEFLKGRDQLRKADEKSVEKKLAAVTEEFKKRTLGEKRIAERRKELLGDYNKFMGKSMEDHAESFGAGIAGAFESLKSGPGGWADVGKKIAAGFAVAGAKAESKGGAVGGIGKSLSALGKTMAVVAGVVAGLAAIIKIVMDAESQAKEFNKTLLEGVGPLDIIDNRLDNIHKRLETIRGAALSWDVFDLGLKTDEAIGVLNAFSQAGYTLKEIRGEAQGAKEEMQAYAGAIKTAATFSRLLGEKADSIATSMSEYMEAMNISLGEIAERYAAVTQAAMQAGFGTKRFYGMVLQATSGMAMFNMRMEEAAGLLLNVSKFMNPKLAGEFVQSLSEGFADMDYKERRKTIMKMGKSTTQRLFGYESQDVAKEFLGETGANVKTGGKAGKREYELLENFLKKFGVETGRLAENTKEQQKNLVAALSKIDEKTAKAMVTELSLSDTGLAIKLEQLIRVSKGTSGKTGDMVRNLDTLTGSRILLAKVLATKGVQGKSVEKLVGELQTMGFESISGISGKALTELVTTMKRYSGNWDLMAKMDVVRFKNAEKDSALMEEFVASQKETAEKFGLVKELNGDILKATVDADGNVVKQKGAIENMEEYIATQGQALMEISKKADVGEMTKLTRNVSTATITMADRLEHGIQKILEEIWLQVSKIVNWITGEKFTPEAKKEREKAVTAVQKRGLGIGQDIMEQEKLIGAAKTKLAGVSPENKDAKKAIEEEIKNRQNHIIALKEEQEIMKKAADTLLDLQTDLDVKKFLSWEGEGIPDANALANAIVTAERDKTAKTERKEINERTDTRFKKEWAPMKKTLEKAFKDYAVAWAEGKGWGKKTQERVGKMNWSPDNVTGGAATWMANADMRKEEVFEKKKGTPERQKAENRYKVAKTMEFLYEKFEGVTAEQKGGLREKIKAEETEKVRLEKKSQGGIEDLNENEKKGLELQRKRDTKTTKFEDYMRKSAPEEWAKASVEAKKRLVAENVVAQAGITGQAGEGLVTSLLAGKMPSRLKEALGKKAPGGGEKTVWQTLEEQGVGVAGGAVGGTLSTHMGVAQDFLVRFGSKGAEIVTKFSKHDDLMVGGARVGGEIDAKTRGAGGAAPTGRGGAVAVHIYGGNQDEVFKTVKRVLQSTGVVPA